jgi:hypothetical protein
MREAIVVYDKGDREIWACANVDSRANNEVRDLKRDFPQLEADLYALSGQTFALGALPRLLWLKRNLPDVYDRMHRVAMLSDWVLARLSGVLASDPSNAGTTGLFSLTARDWLPGAMSKAGMRSDIFAGSVEPGTVIGHVTSAASQETGLAAGTPVVMGGGDCQIGTAGIGVVNVPCGSRVTGMPSCLRHRNPSIPENADRSCANNRRRWHRATLTGKSVISLPGELVTIDRIDPSVVLPFGQGRRLPLFSKRVVFDDIVYGSVRFRRRDMRELLSAEWAASIAVQPLMQASFQTTIRIPEDRLRHGVQAVAAAP